MDSVLHLIGIARKAGRLEIGEEPVGAAARARQARLIRLPTQKAARKLNSTLFLQISGRYICSRHSASAKTAAASPSAPAPPKKTVSAPAPRQLPANSFHRAGRQRFARCSRSASSCTGKGFSQ